MWAYAIALLIGISLGLIGGGGSVLTVPVLVYLFDVEPILATTYSLFIVGCTSLIGGAKAHQKRLVDYRVVALFGIPAIASIFLARQYLLPAIPEEIGSIQGQPVTKGILLLLLFGLLMLIAGISMIGKHRIKQTIYLPGGPPKAAGKEPGLILILPGLAIGLITGMLGAGGGFLIIPTLVLMLGMPMKTAVGTSLLIIAINSLFGFLFSVGSQSPDWQLLLLFTALAIIGILAGGKLSERLSSEILQKAFGWFLLAMGFYIIVKELVIPNFLNK